MNRKALITGASRGIGRAVAYGLAKEGCDLILVSGKSLEALKTIQEEVEGTYPVSCKVKLCDVSNYNQVEELFQEIDDLDILVNNAGIAFTGLLTDMSVLQWHQVIDTNLSGVFYMCKNAVPLMLQKKRGAIINISSVWGERGASMEVAYSASKGGMNGFTKALGKELAPSHISVNAIACGVIDTQMNACYSEEERVTLKEEIPADRFGKVEEVAQMVVQIVEAPEYLTSQVIVLDGGWT